MGRTVQGKRVAFDNIAVGSATGLELTIAGTSLPHGAQTTVFGNGECLKTSPGDTSVAGSAPGREKLWLTVSAGSVSDYVTDQNTNFHA